jgi:hypothetical protein
MAAAKPASKVSVFPGQIEVEVRVHRAVPHPAVIRVDVRRVGVSVAIIVVSLFVGCRRRNRFLHRRGTVRGDMSAAYLGWFAAAFGLLLPDNRDQQERGYCH